MLAAFPAAARGETAFGLTATNQLIVFDADNPGTLLAQVAVTGLAPGDSLVGIDFGPFDVQLYGVGQSGRLYVINPITGLARVIGAGPWNALVGTEFAVDFLPGANRLRVMSDADINLTIDTTTGVVTTETPLSPGNPTIGGAAYAQMGINEPRLYVIDTATDRLGYLDMPSNGVITDNIALGADVTSVAGFDMTIGNVMYAALTVGGVPTFYRVSTLAPVLNSLGPIATGTPLRGLAVLSRHVTMWSVDTMSQHLYRYSTRSTSTVLTDLPIAGTQPGEKILALDFRPSTGQLYGLGSTNRLYRFNLTTGQATQVGGPDAFTPFVASPSVDIDFDPITDQLRATTYSNDSNVRINPDTGAVTVDTALHPWGVEGAAYSIQPGAVSTTLYGLSNTGFFNYSIVRIGGAGGTPSPNEGLVTALWDGTIGFGDSHPGLDMSADGIMYGSGDRLTLQMFLPIHGAGSFGLFPASTNTDGIDGLAIEPFGRLQLASANVELTEAGPAAIVTVNRVLGTGGVIQVDYAVTGITATDGADFTGSSGTLVFLEGQTSKQIVIPIAQDAEDEADETISVTLSNPFLGTTIEGSAAATVTILDDDRSASSRRRSSSRRRPRNLHTCRR